MLGTSAYLLPAVLMLLMTSVLVTATAGPDDEWSWGTVDGRPSSKTPTQATSARNQRTGRQNSGRMVFIDRDAKGRNPRVNLETRFDSHEPVSNIIMHIDHANKILKIQYGITLVHELEWQQQIKFKNCLLLIIRFSNSFHKYISFENNVTYC